MQDDFDLRCLSVDDGERAIKRLALQPGDGRVGSRRQNVRRQSAGTFFDGLSLFRLNSPMGACKGLTTGPRHQLERRLGSGMNDRCFRKFSSLNRNIAFDDCVGIARC